MNKIISFFLFFVMPIAAFSQENAGCTKELGDKAYVESRFEDAAGIYETVIAEQGASLPLYYNLGNAYYRSNQLGKAILNYERALRIDANDEDAKANLEFVQSKIVDKIPQDDIPFYKQWGNSLFALFPRDIWGIIGLSAFVVMLAMIFLYLFKSEKRGTAVVVIVVCIVVTLLANFAAMESDSLPHGVILDEMVVVKSSPDNSGTELTKIHEGLKVTIIDDALDDWVRIEANNGNKVVGWVKAKSVEYI